MGLALDKDTKTEAVSNKKSIGPELTDKNKKESKRKEEGIRRIAEEEKLSTEKKKDRVVKWNLFFLNMLSVSTGVFIFAAALVCFLKLANIIPGGWIDVLSGCVFLVVLAWINERVQS